MLASCEHLAYVTHSFTIMSNVDHKWIEANVCYVSVLDNDDDDDVVVTATWYDQFLLSNLILSTIASTLFKTKPHYSNVFFQITHSFVWRALKSL